MQGFKKDKYKQARGTYSRLLQLSCRVCDKPICTYQKDGPGNLRRLYFDRIRSPKKLAGLEAKSIKRVAKLQCAKCKEDIATPYVYKKENRKAFKVYQDALVKSMRKLGKKT